MLKRGIRQINWWGRVMYFNSGEEKMVAKREKEVKLAQKIKEFLQPTYIKVDDISIGSNSCIIIDYLGGQMYNITVESLLFAGKSRV